MAPKRKAIQCAVRALSTGGMGTLAKARHPAFHSNGSMIKLNQGGTVVGHHPNREDFQAHTWLIPMSDHGAHNNDYDYDYSVMGGVTSESKSTRVAIKPGETCLGEVTAYMLDHNSFTSVPMTILSKAHHPAFHSNGSMIKLKQGGTAVGHHPNREDFQAHTWLIHVRSWGSQ